MSKWLKCDACGATYYHKDDHDCPGSVDDRFAALEARIEELEEEVAELREKLEAPK